MADSPQIEIRPVEVRLSSQTDKTFSSHVVLHNPTNETCAFKVMTTAPRKYCVRPTTGYVEAMGTLQIELLVQGRRALRTDDETTVDKFIVLTTPAEKTDIGPKRDLFVETTGSDLQKAPFVVVASNNLQSDVPSNEGVEQKSTGEKRETVQSVNVKAQQFCEEERDVKKGMKGRSSSVKLQDEVHLLLKRSRLAAFSSRFSFRGRNKEEKASERLVAGTELPQSGRLFGNYFVHAISSIATQRHHG